MRTHEPSQRLTAALLLMTTLAACCLFAVDASGRRAGARSVSARGVAHASTRASAAPAAARRGVGKRASLGGVSFTYDSSLASEAKGEVAPGGGCGKPGDVMPRHVAFTLAGYPKPHASPFMQPEIQVFPVAEYRRALAACEKEVAAVTQPPVNFYVSDFDDQVRTLKALNAARPAPRRLSAWLKKTRGREFDSLPFVPMYDMSEALRAKVSYIDFSGGRGVAFVVLYTIEDTIVTNQALAYVFQGLTGDGAYYVSATFPVAAPFLPREFTVEEAVRLGLGQTVLTGTRLERRYKNYLAANARRLEALAPDKYRPGLNLIQDLLRSLAVNPAAVKAYLNPK